MAEWNHDSRELWQLQILAVIPRTFGLGRSVTWPCTHTHVIISTQISSHSENSHMLWGVFFCECLQERMSCLFLAPLPFFSLTAIKKKASQVHIRSRRVMQPPSTRPCLEVETAASHLQHQHIKGHGRIRGVWWEAASFAEIKSVWIVNGQKRSLTKRAYLPTETCFHVRLTGMKEVSLFDSYWHQQALTAALFSQYLHWLWRVNIS